ncbi:ABC transporter permease [Lysinibacillus xylanilyticus]|uniref:ABC transporter permease n=1 Tax=Lysinibacillus xylanilyticus TaxID=582475 RepID=UPI0037FC69E2
MTNLVSLTGFQIKLLFRNYKGLILGFSLPIIMFFIFGNLLSKYSVYDGIPLSDALVPAYIPIIIINGILIVFGQNFLVYKEQGNLLKYKLLGISEITVATSIYIATLLFQILATITLIIFANLTKNVGFPIESSLKIIVAFLLINLFEFSIVYFVTSFMNKSTTYQSLSLLIFYFQIFLGGLTFPPEMFPTVLKDIVYIFNPIIYGLEMMRSFWLQNGSILDNLKEITLLIGWSSFFIALGTIVNLRKRASSTINNFSISQND